MFRGNASDIVLLDLIQDLSSIILEIHKDTADCSNMECSTCAFRERCNKVEDFIGKVGSLRGKRKG